VTHVPETKQADPYEAVLYPGYPFAQTHPDRLFLIGVLHGLDPAPPDDCRILEIGCGDGMNIVAMAANTPGIRGIGIDRAAKPLARGRRYAEALRLDVELRGLDLLDAAEADFGGPFDYVVSHGVYAWVPEPVREALLALVGRVLAPEGVAFVSYNALPGGHVRRAMRDMLRFHAAGAASPSEAAARAREMTAFFQRWDNRTDPYGIALEHELKRVGTVNDYSLIHDDLGEVWDPCSLSDFVGRAEVHGLRYVADAEVSELRIDRYPDGVDEAVRELAGGDPVLREQYGDFVSGRAFRQTLLCRADRTPPPSADPVATGVERLRMSSTHAPDPLGDGGFASDIDAACSHLSAVAPRTMAFDELAAATGLATGALAAAILVGFRASLIDLHAREVRAATTVPERPEASRLARLMALEGPMMATLEHQVFTYDDLFAQHLLAICDGKRDHAELVDAMLAAVGHEIVVEIDGEPLVAGEELRGPFAARVEEFLQVYVEARLLLEGG
jgi:SAM-dependent methyltransferase